MTPRIVINNLEVMKYVAEEAGVGFNPERDNCIGLVRTTQLFTGALHHEVRGGVLFQWFTDVSVMMHMAGADPKWATPDFITMVFDYAFRQLGCERVFGLLEESNLKARAIDRRLGFREVSTIPRMFASGDAIVVCMERTDCRWLNRPLRRWQAGLVGGVSDGQEVFQGGSA